MTEIQSDNETFEDKYVRKRFGIFRGLLSPYLIQGTRMLEIGCYTANLLRFLPPFVEYFGIDIDENALEIARQRGAKTMKLDLDNEEIPLKQKFDVIIATEILEHLRDPEKLILEIKCLAEKGGVILISLPNECTIYHRLKVLFGKGIDGTGFAPCYHLHFPTLKQDSEFMEKHFEIVKKSYWVHLGVGKMEKCLSWIPDRIWTILADLYPSLFARGVIYLCKIREEVSL